MNYCQRFLDEIEEIASLINENEIEAMVQELVALRERHGRLFIFGLGGSAANASHAVNDFRKLCGIEASTPTDNVAELTARANDEGWRHIFSEWLDFDPAQNYNDDAILILSVGRGTDIVSVPIVSVIGEAQANLMTILGIVGRDGGETAKYANCCIVIPTIVQERVTPHTEAFQSVILHCIVSHPDLQRNKTKW